MTTTTIKVSRSLRDRIAERARVQGVTMAVAIEAALDASDEQRFWDAVRAEHAALTAEERSEYASTGVADDLADAADELISKRGEW